MSNLFTDTAGITTYEGLHQATIISTHHVGKRKILYGLKDFQMFKLQVKQFSPENNEWETAEIHQQYHRSFSPQASLTTFLAALGIKAHRGMTLDFDDTIGKKINILVTHSKDAHGTIHANVKPMLQNGDAQRALRSEP
jgi:hypothetical protein